jgi:hypothetical protein
VTPLLEPWTILARLVYTVIRNARGAAQRNPLPGSRNCDDRGPGAPCHDAAMPREGRTARYVLAALALAAMLALAPFFLASGLMAPGWAVTLFLVVWLGLFLLGVVWIRRRPLWVLPLPFVAALIWLGGMSAGGAWLGWTA